MRVRVGVRLGADARGRALAARIVHAAIVAEGIAMTATRWGADFAPDRLAILELRMWKAYYRRQPARLFGNLVLGLREQAHASWPRALVAAGWLTKAAVGFGRATGDYERFAPDVARGYRTIGLPATVDIEAVAREELRWWVVRREIGLAAGTEAGTTITRLYAAFYRVPEAAVAEAGRLRGEAAEVRDRGAAADPDGPRGAGSAYWPEVGRLLVRSYRSLSAAVREPSVSVTVGDPTGSVAVADDWVA